MLVNIAEQKALETAGEHQSLVEPVNMKDAGRVSDEPEDNATAPEVANSTNSREQGESVEGGAQTAGPQTTLAATTTTSTSAPPAPTTAQSRLPSPPPGPPLEPAASGAPTENGTAATQPSPFTTTTTFTPAPNITGEQAINTEGEHESFVAPVNMKEQDLTAARTSSTTTSTPNITGKPAMQTEGEHQSLVDPVGMKEAGRPAAEDSNKTASASPSIEPGPANATVPPSTTPPGEQASTAQPASAANQSLSAPTPSVATTATTTVRLVHPPTTTTGTTTRSSTSSSSTRRTRTQSTTAQWPPKTAGRWPFSGHNRPEFIVNATPDDDLQMDTTTLGQQDQAPSGDNATSENTGDGSEKDDDHSVHRDKGSDFRTSEVKGMGGRGDVPTNSETRKHQTGSKGAEPTGMRHKHHHGSRGGGSAGSVHPVLHKKPGRPGGAGTTSKAARHHGGNDNTTKHVSSNSNGTSDGAATAATTTTTNTLLETSTTSESMLKQADEEDNIFIPVERGESWDSSPYVSQGHLDRLWEYLFNDYRKEVPPVPLDGGPLAVGVGINFVKFKDFDEVAGTMNIALNLRLCWDDHRLSFDAQEFFNMTWSKEGDKVPLESGMIWTPDVTVLNEVGGLGRLLSTEHSSPLVLSDDVFKNSTGVNILWSRPLDVVSNCEVDMTQYPFDEQRCYIVIGSWASSRRQMLLVPQPFFAEYTVHTSEFRVRNITVIKKDVYTRNTAQKFNEVVFSVVLQRYPHFYVMNFILPMVALTGLAVATMWISPSNIGPRVNSGTKMLLCVVSIIFITARHRPAIHGDIWMDRFQSHCLALAMSAVLESLAIDWLTKTSKNLSWFPKVDMVDSMLRALICSVTTFMICVDASEIERYNVLELHASFEADSTRLLVAFVYIIFCGLLLSSFCSVSFLILPKRWQHRVLGRGEDSSPGSDTATSATTQSKPGWLQMQESVKRRSKSAFAAAKASPGRLPQPLFGTMRQYSLLKDEACASPERFSP